MYHSLQEHLAATNKTVMCAISIDIFKNIQKY